MYGNFFRRLMRLDVQQCDDVESIISVVERNFNTKLHVKSYSSSAVPTRGNIFPYTRKDNELDSKIDRYLRSAK